MLANYQQRLNTIASVSNTYGILQADDVVLVTGNSSYSVTLPTAVGRKGKIYHIKRVDQNLANIVTIATTSVQTIDGVTTQTLATQYEEYLLQSDGANWFIKSHTYPKAWVAYTPTVTNLTIADEGTFWRRDGDSIFIKSTFSNSGNAPAVLSFSLPTGLTFDAAKMASTTNTNSHGIAYNISGLTQFPATALGGWPIFSDTSTTTNLFYVAITNSGSRLAKVNASSVYAVGDRGRFEISSAPITNWKG